MPCVVSSLHKLCIINRVWHRWFLRLNNKRKCSFCLGILNHFFFGSWAARLWGTSSCSVGKMTTEELRPPNSNCSIYEPYVGPTLEVAESRPQTTAVPVNIWLQLYNRTTQLSFWIPDPQELWEIINVYCCFKLQKFNIIYYVDIDNQYRFTGKRVVASKLVRRS